MYTFMKTVNLTVVQVDSLALVIVYPLAISRRRARNETSLAPIKSPPKVVEGPSPVKAYFVQATPWNNIPSHCRTALNENSL